MRPYSTQFIGQTVTPSRTTANYTVPAGFRAVVRSVIIATSTAVAQLVIVYVEKPPTPFYLYLVEHSTRAMANLEMHQVVMAGQQIVAYTTTGTAFVGVGGYLLTE